MEWIYRKRKALFYAAAGIAASASAVALYNWYNEWCESAAKAGDAHSSHPAALLELAKGTESQIAEAAEDCHIFSSSPSMLTRNHSRVKMRDEQSLDQMMDSHFSFIQDVSTPQELDQLLPRLKAALIQLTDIKQLKQQQQEQEQEQGGSTISTTSAAAQLKNLARLCFLRALGACWLVPCMDLLVRVKLNLIGRHLFLQEKLGKLRKANAQSAGGSLPPRLSPTAIEAFLDCSWLAQSGCQMVLDKVSDGIDVVLSDLPLDGEVSPSDLFQIMANMLREIEAAMLRCQWRPQSPTVYPSAMLRAGSLHPHTPSNGSPLPGLPEEVSSEKNGVSEDCEMEVAWESVCSTSASLPEPSDASGGYQYKGLGNPWAEMLAGPSRSAFIDTEEAWRQGPDAYQNASTSAAMVQELHSELCSILGSARFTEAMRAAVQHTFRAAAANIYSSFPAAATGTSSPDAAATQSVPSFSRKNSLGSQSNERPGQGLRRSHDSRIFGTVPSNTFFATNTGMGVIKPPRPLARVLRGVQGSGDLTFENIKAVTKGIAALPNVMALSANAFACTSQLGV